MKHTGQTAPTHNQQSSAQEQFNGQMNLLAMRVPEINDRFADLATTGNHIINDYGIKANFFEDTGRTMVFTAIAGSLHDAQGIESDSAYKAEMQFLANTCRVLCADYSEKSAPKSAEPNTLEEDPALREGVYAQYENPELAASLQQAIDSGLIGATQERMGITPENELPYRVRVLNVASDADLFGIASPIYQYDATLPPDESLRLSSEARDAHEKVKSYKAELLQNGKDFSGALGREEAGTYVFARKGVDDVQEIFISAAVASKLVDPTVTQHLPAYDDEARQKEVAKLAHEYVHAQGSSNIDHKSDFGISLEERRAELFSGDQQGYLNVKTLLGDVNVVTGCDIADIIAQHPRGEVAGDVLADVAAKLGLRATLELATIRPTEYIGEDKGYSRYVDSFLGSYDGVIDRLLTAQIKAGKQSEIEARVDQMAGQLITRGNAKDWSYYRKKILNINTVTDLVVQRVAARTTQP